MRFLLNFILCALVAFSVNVGYASDVTRNGNPEKVIQFTDAEQSSHDGFLKSGRNILFADATVPDKSDQKVTPQDVAEVIEEKVQPMIDVVVDRLDNAPPPESTTSEKVNYWIMAAFMFGSVVVGLFVGGSSANRFKNLRTT